MAAKPTPNNGSAGQPERPLNVGDFILEAYEMAERAKELQAEADRAKETARAYFDTVYDELAKLKADSKDIDTFRSSKLGKLLENIR